MHLIIFVAYVLLMLSLMVVLTQCWMTPRASLRPGGRMGWSVAIVLPLLPHLMRQTLAVGVSVGDETLESELISTGAILATLLPALVAEMCIIYLLYRTRRAFGKREGPQR